MSGFQDLFDDYKTKWADANARAASHDQLRFLFTNFVQLAFPAVSIHEVTLEQFVKGLNVRGFVDLLYRNLIFEFKKDFESERTVGIGEIQKYIAVQTDPNSYLGILTDGRTFEVFRLESGNLEGLTGRFDLFTLSPEEARTQIDSWFFADRAVAPTSTDMIMRFGAKSAVYNLMLRDLKQALASVRSSSELETKYSEWQNLLSHVYGSQTGDDSLFIRHTYLAMLSRLLAFVGITRRVPRKGEISGVLNGSAFRAFGIDNLVESDFFGWIFDQSIASSMIDDFLKVATHLNVYDFHSLSEDVLKELYQDLVEHDERHDLGEYYTPDWLAEHVLREAGYGQGKTLLDPACGSGTFLFTAIRLLRGSGLSGRALVDEALTTLVGIDVHPLAVMIAKVNVLLALLPDISGVQSSLPGIPVYLADSLRLPGGPGQTVTIPVALPASAKRPPGAVGDRFELPASLAGQPDTLSKVIDRSLELALATTSLPGAGEALLRQEVTTAGLQAELPFILANYRLLDWLVQQKRDTVWAFILKNAFRPSYCAARKFDIVAGNPPWLAMRYVRRPDYKAEIGRLSKRYSIAGGGSVWTYSQMELSTLFYAFCQDNFLSDDGTLAFVMPRSVLTGAKQHAGFRDHIAPMKVIDLERVEPLFRVPACVLVGGRQNAAMAAVPVQTLVGHVEPKNARYVDAFPKLVASQTQFDWTTGQLAVRSPHYHAKVREGAILVPRSFWFVQPSTAAIVLNSSRPQVETDEAIASRPPWRGTSLSGAVESQFLFASALSDDLVPFGLRHIRLAVAPFEPPAVGGSGPVWSSSGAAGRGWTGLAAWVAAAQEVWESHRSPTSQKELTERIDILQNLSRQAARSPFHVVYNSSGTHLAAAVIRLSDVAAVEGLATAGFIVPETLWVYRCDDELEAHYLSAVLNSPALDLAIKPHQPKGAFGAAKGGGERHIHRRPFEVAAIDAFDPNNADHMDLADISRQCHGQVATMTLPRNRRIGRVRSDVRETLSAELSAIDAIVSNWL